MQNIDTQIRELLFSDLSLDFSFVKKTLSTLPKKSEALKRDLQKKLKEHLLGFVQEVSQVRGTDQHQNYCLRAKEHLKKWEEHFGQVHFEQVVQLCKHTELPLLEIAEELISPTALCDYAQKFVKGQEAYLKKLSLSLYTHFQRLRHPDLPLPKANLLAYGPTSSGKTFSVQVLANVLGYEFGVVNCNAVVQEGIVGSTLTSAFEDIYKRTNKNLEAVEKAIILFDEFDKLFYSGSYNERVLNELLNLIDDDGKASFANSKGIGSEQIPISTKRMLFLFTGVFDQLFIGKDDENTVGFNSSLKKNKKTSDPYAGITREDFFKIIKKKEILGRITDLVALKPITPDILMDILQGDSSPVLKYESFFSLHNITLQTDPKALKYIASCAAKKQLGVRGLNTLLWETLQEDMQQVQVAAKSDTPKTLIVDVPFLKRKMNP